MNKNSLGFNQLADAFCKEEKKSFAQNKLKHGSVIKAFVKDTIPPKEKRFIIVGINEEQLFLASIFINSKINPNKLNNEIKKAQLHFESESRDYLDYPSYIDCSKIYERKYSEITNILINAPQAYLGDVSETDMKLIKETISACKMIPVRIKKLYNIF